MVATTTKITGSEPAGSLMRAVGEGTKVGRLVVLEEIGAGGMGRVYRSYDPKLRREVAIKVLKRAGSEEERARILREAQALAQLSHPNVVAIYDVGEHERELFISMEYVEGTTLKGWLDQPRRWRDALDVLRQAGAGLVAAHAEGIVHRDFKPANVLVGDDGRVRVMDFGLARAVDAVATLPEAHTDPELSASQEALASPVTEAGFIMGTPAYMAPEQEVGAPTDERADQYAFCVTAFEALFRRRPFAGPSPDDFAAQKRKPVPVPSDPRIPAGIRRAIARGLEPDPQQRWPSLAALLAELARDPSKGRARATVLGAVAIVAGAAWAASAAIEQGKAARCEGDAAQIDDVWNQRSASQVRDAMLTSGVGYAETSWHKARPWLDRYANDWRAARARVCIATRVNGERSDDLYRHSVECLEERKDALGAALEVLSQPYPEVVQGAVGAATGLPQVARCEDDAWLLQRARPPSGTDSKTVAEIRGMLGRTVLLRRTGRFRDGMRIASAALEKARRLGWDPLTATAMEKLGALQEEAGDTEAAERTLVAAFFLAGRSAHDESAAVSAMLLAFLMSEDQGRYDDARMWSQMAEMALGRLGQIGKGLTWVAFVDTAANIDQREGLFTEAVAGHHRALALAESEVGPDHPRVGKLMTNLSNSYWHAGDNDAALRYAQRSLWVRERQLGSDHPAVAQTLTSIANASWMMGRLDRAVPPVERALAIRERAHGADSIAVASSLGNLGSLYGQMGDARLAGVHIQRALAIFERRLSPMDKRIGDALGNLGLVSRLEGDLDGATAYLKRALEILEATVGPDHHEVGNTLNNLGVIARVQGRNEDALAYHRRALELRVRTLGTNRTDTATSVDNVGVAYLQLGQHERALAYFVRALAILERALGPGNPRTKWALEHIGIAHRELGNYARAVPYIERAIAIREHEGGAPRPLATSRFELARALWGIKRERRRALELAHSARDELHALGSAAAQELEEADAWLARH